MIITGQSGKIEVKDMLQHSLGPMLWELTTAEDQQGGIGFLTAKECPAT